LPSTNGCPMWLHTAWHPSAAVQRWIDQRNPHLSCRIG
jgi:hypothetical protein